MQSDTAKASFVRRATGAALLNPQIYEEVEADRTATIQAMAVVLLSSLATGIGALGPLGPRPAVLLTISLLAMVVWVVWSVLIFQIGTRLLPSPNTRADVGELLRVTGFAAAPGILRVAGLVPGVASPVFVLTTVWMLTAMVVGVRQALDYTSTSRAIAVCTLGLALALGFAWIIGLIFPPVVQ